MPSDFTIGDVIRKKRESRRWNQERLGEEAKYFKFRDRDQRINKSTVSKVEKDPYSSKLGTVWRLLMALDLTFSDIEKQIGVPIARELKAVRRVVGAGTDTEKKSKRAGAREI